MTYSLLTDSLVLEIKRRIWSGDTAKALAVKFDVSESTILLIRQGKRWKKIAWPDESTGALPETRQAAIIKARREVGREGIVKVRKKLREGDVG